MGDPAAGHRRIAASGRCRGQRIPANGGARRVVMPAFAHCSAVAHVSRIRSAPICAQDNARFSGDPPSLADIRQVQSSAGCASALHNPPQQGDHEQRSEAALANGGQARRAASHTGGRTMSTISTRDARHREFEAHVAVPLLMTPVPRAYRHAQARASRLSRHPLHSTPEHAGTSCATPLLI